MMCNDVPLNVIICVKAKQSQCRDRSYSFSQHRPGDMQWGTASDELDSKNPNEWRWIMLRKIAISIGTFLFLSVTSYTQDAPKVSVRIKAILLDHDLNQKPVGKTKFTVVPFDS